MVVKKKQSKVEWGRWSLKRKMQGLYPVSFHLLEPIIKYKLLKIQSNALWHNSTEVSRRKPCIRCSLKSAPHASVSLCLQSNLGAAAAQLAAGEEHLPVNRHQGAAAHSNLDHGLYALVMIPEFQD